jgi:hypothetical protein
MATVAETNSLFEIDTELDLLLDKDGMRLRFSPRRNCWPASSGMVGAK